jgi:ABC-2 type transport system permease protein
MSSILKLIKLDKALIKPYYKYFLIFFLLPAFMAVSFKNITQSVVYAISLIAMTSSYTFTIAEKNDLNRLYGLLPVSKKDIVAGRYIFVILMGFVAILISLGSNLIALIITNVPFSIHEVIISISVGITLYALFTAIQLPGLFKFGAIKGRLLTLVPFIGIFIVGPTINNINSSSLKNGSPAILNSTFGILMTSILLAVVLYGISIGICQRIYNKMEL